jgi:hypothetical protein
MADITVQPLETILGSGAGGPLSAPGPWIQEKDSTSNYIFYPYGVVVGSAPNKGNGSVSVISLYVNGVAVNPLNYLPYSGGTMTGILTLFGDPIGTKDAATKNYVDTQITNLTSNISAAYLHLTGGTLTGPLILAADPVNPLGTATKQYVDNANALQLSLTGGTLTGPLILAADPTVVLGAATKQYVDKFLPLTGGTLTGLLTLSGAPTAPLHATTKQYVDSQITTVNGTFANYLPLAGGTLTGPLTLNADPATNFQAATKQYVDTHAAGFTIPDAPSDGNTYGRKNAAWVNAQVIDIGTY